MKLVEWSRRRHSVRSEVVEQLKKGWRLKKKQGSSGLHTSDQKGRLVPEMTELESEWRNKRSRTGLIERKAMKMELPLGTQKGNSGWHTCRWTVEGMEAPAKMYEQEEENCVWASGSCSWMASSHCQRTAKRVSGETLSLTTERGDGGH
jgi:hypothetical protein